MLHIISKSLYQSRSAGAGIPSVSATDIVLLIGDGVYNDNHPDLIPPTQIFAIEDDRITRGLNKQTHVQYIDHNEMVTLTEQHHPIVTWY